MRILSLLLIALAFSSAVSAQTNTFPATGNVGIGTTSPGTLLHIKSSTTSSWIGIDKPYNYEGGLQFQRAGATMFYFYSDNSDNDALKIQSGAGLAGEDDANPRIHIPYTNKNLFFVQSGGSIGVGTTNLGNERVSISGNSQWQIRLRDSGAGGGDWRLGASSNNWGVTNGKFLISNSDLSTNAAFTIDNSKNVGIGTTSPDSRMHIEGTGGVTVDLKVNGRVQTGDANNFGGVWFNNPATMFAGQRTASSLGLYNNGAWRLVVNSDGKIGIGTNSPDQQLTVKGKIHAEEVIIDLAVPAPDYVFEKTYDLKSLDDVKVYIDHHKHLPEVPSAKEMETNGVKVGEMEMILLKKIEELTLHAIKASEEMKAMRTDYQKLLDQNIELSNDIKLLKTKQ